VTVTPELRAEGMARELINRIQNIRKSRDYNITDRIRVIINPDDLINDAVKAHNDYIAGQVLASTLELTPVTATSDDETLDIDGTPIVVNIQLDK
ncbi:MAG: hypothetical protein K2G21_06505, partial [Muribaculaceae bacterium]|nr:hypothetical protein [Muribaculaceae bacterium]